ncbi:unnamed protein product [Moneuplotes crassus]|uniref:N-acetyltransferase domain-containing protein n=1 Tax=Euplotes crassus TaxID=5936 RepID=A0AAD1Y0R7_EUPCR|nr:unnamed protein product [Moneuplotes crassus]
METTEQTETKESNIEVIFGKPEHSEILGEFSAKIAYEAEGNIVDPKPLAEAIHNLLSFDPAKEGQKPLGFYLVAQTSEAKVIGCMMVTYQINPVIGGLIYSIDNVFVEKEYRKLGVFKQIFNKVKDIAEADKNCKCMRLFVEQENEIAKKAYTRMGMSILDVSAMQKSFISYH